MGNLNPRCQWPSCSCETEKGAPCRFEDPDYYVNKAGKPATTTADCRWPSCGCADDACMFENPSYYLKMRDAQGPGSQVAVVPMLTEDQRALVETHVRALEDDSNMAEILARHYKAEFDACWGPPAVDEAGARGDLLNQRRALELRDVVLDGPRRAKQARELAAVILLLLGDAK